MKFNHIRRWLCAMLAALMVFFACGSLADPPAGGWPEQLTFEDLAAFGAKAAVHDGRVTFVDGACTAAPVMNMDDASKVVNAMLNLIGGDSKTCFDPWRTLTDAKGNYYYVFQQTYAGTTVPGGAVKVITDARNHMQGLVASVASDLPDAADSEGITAQQAEETVLQHLREISREKAERIEGRTERIILPVNPDIDPDSEDEVEDARCRYVWAVYTTNPEEANAERPYLAHYVAMDGAYLYSLPTILPGDEAGSAGYDAAYVFENMEPVDYTGNVVLSDDTEQKITVTLMRDKNTGRYYLGNIERRIAVADCYEFIYNQGHVVLEESGDNNGWDQTCLLSLYNYCKVWDYYHEIGWTGADGLGTPILILKDFCNRDHQPINNAAFAGKYYGWQTFLSSSANDLSQCLDVLAHEFTHCVTASVMTFSAYMNDYGAINEAVSDIQGNLCEMMAGETEDTTWLLGENSESEAIRSMSDPHRYTQPEYTWDLYYMPNVNSPTEINDRGGVHANSSLLNNVAYRLCEKGGMTLKDARAFWFAVDCAMVPGTDYVQLSELLPWVLRNQGLEKYETALEAAMDATRLRTAAEPDTFDSNRAMVTLTLPDIEHFQDGNWNLMILSADTDEIYTRIQDILARRGKYAAMLDELAACLGIDPLLLPTESEIAENPEHAWDNVITAFGQLFSTDDDKKVLGVTEYVQSGDLATIFRKYFGDTLYSGQVSAGQDGRTIRMVSLPGTAIPLLYRLEFDTDLHVKSAGLAVYAFGKWIDIGSLASPFLAALVESAAEEKADAGTDEPEESADFSWLEALFGSEEASASEETAQSETDLSWLGDLLVESGIGETLMRAGGKALGFVWNMVKDMLFWTITPAVNNTLSNNGLDTVSTISVENCPFLRDMFTF